MLGLLARRLPRCAALGLLFAAACGAPPSSTEAVGEQSAPIINGTDSTSAQDAVVRLVGTYPDGVQEEGFVCTATLLAPNLVITARHCVSQLESDSGFACDDKGNVVSGNASLGADYPPTSLFVQVGTTLSPATTLTSFTSGDAHGIQIFHDSSTILCNHDQALILLDHAIPNAVFLPVRLDATAKAKEGFTAVGWGVTTTTLDPSTRQQRTGLTVSAVGSTNDTTLGIPLASNEFDTGEATCEGDSGGPALDPTTGAIIGTVSRGTNDNSDPTTIASSCTNPGAANIYSEPAGFKAVILQAYAAADATPWYEGQPSPGVNPPASASSSSSSGGCALTAPRRDDGDAALVALGVALAVTARRRRRS